MNDSCAVQSILLVVELKGLLNRSHIKSDKIKLEKKFDILEIFVSLSVIYARSPFPLFNHTRLHAVSMVWLGS